MDSFKEFVSAKDRQATKQLKILEGLLKKNNFEVKNFSDVEEPYIFVVSPNKDLSFDGVRVYPVGGSFAYRVQKEARTHPFGKAYPLNVEDMYEDILTDEHIDEEKAGKLVIEMLAKELNKFFERSAVAEKESRADGYENDFNISVSSTTGTDYANMVHNPGT
jgi:hypothetical protein